MCVFLFVSSEQSQTNVWNCRGVGGGIGCVPRQILIPFIGCLRSFMSTICYYDATFEPYLYARSLNTAVGDRQLRQIRLSIRLSEWNGSAPTRMIFVKF